MGVVFSFDQESLSEGFFPRGEGRMVEHRFILRLSLGLNVKDDVEISLLWLALKGQSNQI